MEVSSAALLRRARLALIEPAQQARLCFFSADQYACFTVPHPRIQMTNAIVRVTFALSLAAFLLLPGALHAQEPLEEGQGAYFLNTSVHELEFSGGKGESVVLSTVVVIDEVERSRILDHILEEGTGPASSYAGPGLIVDLFRQMPDGTRRAVAHDVWRGVVMNRLHATLPETGRYLVVVRHQGCGTARNCGRLMGVGLERGSAARKHWADLGSWQHMSEQAGSLNDVISGLVNRGSQAYESGRTQDAIDYFADALLVLGSGPPCECNRETISRLAYHVAALATTKAVTDYQASPNAGPHDLTRTLALFHMADIALSQYQVDELEAPKLRAQVKQNIAALTKLVR